MRIFRLLLLVVVSAFVASVYSKTVAATGVGACLFLEWILLAMSNKKLRMPIELRLTHELLVKDFYLKSVSCLKEFGFGLYGTKKAYFYMTTSGTLYPEDRDTLLSYVYYYKKRFKEQFDIEVIDVFNVGPKGTAILNPQGDNFNKVSQDVIKLLGYIRVYKAC